MNLPITVTQSDLLEILLNVAPVRPVFIWGAPGIGKSALVEKFAEEVGLPCVSLLGSQLAPEDIIGIPQIRGETSEFLPPKMIARKEPYVLFLDELNACSQEVQKAFYSLIHEHRIGEMPGDGLLYDETLRGQSTEAIYDTIVKEMRKFRKGATFRGYGHGDIFGNGTPRFEGADKGVSLDEFFKSSLREGLDFHITNRRGYLPAGLVEEVRALSMPPIPWEVELGKWFDYMFPPLEKHRTYARPSRRQSATPDIPRPSYVLEEKDLESRTFGVVVDTSGSMSTKQIGLALGAIASYAVSKDVPFVRVVFCDAAAVDVGYLLPEEIAGRVEVTGRGGTLLQPGIDLLEKAKDFPAGGPILIITDGYIEDTLRVRREHAFLLPKGNRLPFRAKGKVFYFRE